MSVPDGWVEEKLSDVVELQRGFDLPAQARRPGPYPVLTSGETSDVHDEGPVRGPGFVVGRATNLGRPKWSDGDFWPHNTTMFAKDFKGNDPRWLFHLFEATDLTGYDSGSVQPMLNRNYISGVRVLVPPLPEQQAIAEVLGALDDKIAANTKLATAADELARITFLSALGDAVEVPLSSTAQFVNGKAFTKEASGTGRVVVRIAELNSGIGGSTVYSDADVEDRYVARAGDILFAWSGSLTLHRWFRDDAIVNQHIFKVIPNDGYPAWLVYQLIASKLAQFKEIAADKATTMGHIQRHHLDEPVLVPGAKTVKEIHTLMTALLDSSLNASRQNLTLAATRDALLPQLMSGKLRVRDAEAAASPVGA
ncbi:restriction endonuclease subunit S [Microbacterium terrisoli]|uniref:restriction endonuclease subunit S n=1 Tax=Microbacterium terrisoli TaxID=3242192 RepID=UPI00280396B2|nr:restriction endonuclease subunit S [Microbacterium protaetiae]